MTLATDMWVTGPISIQDRETLWQLGRELIYHFSDRDGPALFTDKPPHSIYEPQDMVPGVRDRDHGIGQGFCSMYDFRYQFLGYPVEQYDGIVHESDCEPDCTWHHNSPATGWWVKIRLDTSYGFRMESPEGFATWGCGDLHAAIVSIMGEWLTRKGISWHWENEFTGEIHEGPEGLSDLGMSGAAAHNWMLNTVAPALEASVGPVTWL